MYPALKYYLRRGDEGLCQQELEKLLSQLAVCGEEDREGGGKKEEGRWNETGIRETVVAISGSV